MNQIEIEMRLYLTREPGEKRECIVSRNIPHAMQVWEENAHAYSRNLELVISGDWLQNVIEKSELRGGCEEIDENTRAEVLDLCLKGLRAQDAESKQQYLKKVLDALGYDLSKLNNDNPE